MMRTGAYCALLLRNIRMRQDDLFIAYLVEIKYNGDSKGGRMMGDTYSLGITGILFAAVILSGMYQVYTGKALGMSQEIYTKESLDAFARPAGIVQVLFGAAAVVTALGINQILESWAIWAGIAVMAVTIIAEFLMMKKMLVKRK